MIQLILAAIEFVKGSSYSDPDDKRLRGISDLGISSDQEFMSSTPQNTLGTITLFSQRNGDMLGSSPPEGPNAPVFDFGPYYSEYSNGLLALTGSQSSRRSGSEIMDPETSFKDFKFKLGEVVGEVERTPGEFNWMDLVIKRESRQKLQAEDETAQLLGDVSNFENNVSNAAFIDYATNPNASLLHSSAANSGSNSTNSPVMTEKEAPLTEAAVVVKAKEELKKSLSDSNLAAKDTTITISTTTAAEAEVAPQRQPFSYKEALEKYVEPTTMGKSSFIPIKRTDANVLKSQSSSAAKTRATLTEMVDLDRELEVSGKGKKSASGFVRRKSPQSKKEELNPTKLLQQQHQQFISSHMHESLKSSIQQRKQKVMRTYESTIKQESTMKQESNLTPNQPSRIPASPTDICKIISKSIGTHGAVPIELPADISSIPRPQVSAKTSTRSVHEPEQQPIPEGAISYTTWSGNFRMPTAYAPKVCPNVFKFPTSPRSDPTFLSQLEEFRKGLQMFEGKPIEGCKFKDFQPKLNFYTANNVGGSQKISDKKLFTTSPPIKVFDAPPIRSWIPVRCDALDVDLRHERNVDGHAGKGGGKAQVSVVYDANRSTAEKKVYYIRKEYYDLEYFTNEYNFLQFANHQHIPKPLCVVYDPYPTIVMDFVPGERVHIAFYHLGISFRDQYPDDQITQRKQMSIALSKVLAKILVTLRYIHSIGFIHADLKPENIIFDLRSGRIAIIDFDLSVSAPYAFTGRGTEATVAPEVYGLLKGPVHFGIDWWAYGSTAAMMIAAALAGLCYDIDFVVEQTMNYVPFKYIRSTNQYEMTPIPKYFSPVMRSFLYPFFNPDPSKRVFSEINAYNWIRVHAMFSCVENWDKYEHVDLGPYASLSPIQIGFLNFTNSPRLLKPLTRISKIFNHWSQMFSAWSTGTSVAKPDTSTTSMKAESEEEDDDDEEESDDSIEEESNDYAGEMFTMDLENK